MKSLKTFLCLSLLILSAYSCDPEILPESAFDSNLISETEDTEEMETRGED